MIIKTYLTSHTEYMSDLHSKNITTENILHTKNIFDIPYLKYI